MTESDKGAKISIDTLLALTGADRTAKAYAFLYAAFKKSENNKSPVRDALDCLLPFVAPYLNKVPGKQVDLEAVQAFLKSTFGFDVPLYAIESLMPGLATAGYCEFNRAQRAYFAKKHLSSFDIAKSELELDFDRLIHGLEAYSKRLGFMGRPPSGTWGDALIAFLKTQHEKPPTIVTKIKGALLDPNHVEEAIVGGFIRTIYFSNYQEFEKLLQIFMGVLIEEFISSVSEMGTVDSNSPLNIYFDTGLLLRVLGCSGKLLQVATEELTRYLQDLGCSIFYFAGNEIEVENILDTIVHVKDSGGELEGETAAALSDGEINITEIRMLKGSFPERLAQKNIFPATRAEADIKASAKYQIDELAFEGYLLSQANKSKRAYSTQNRKNDAGYLGNVVRLRKGMTTRDLAECRHLFVTPNNFLAVNSRRFLIENKMLRYQYCAPMLSVGQVATIAWLMKDNSLVPEKAGRELLSNCFAAVRPDAEWFGFFREGLEKTVGSLEDFVRDPKNSLALQAARRIAQEESFGSAALVRQLNLAEIMQRAKIESDSLLQEKESEATNAKVEVVAERERSVLALEIQRDELQAQYEKQSAKAALEAAEHARIQLAAQIRESTRRRAHKIASRVSVAIRLLFAAAFVGAGIAKSAGVGGAWLWVATGFLGLIALLEVLHLLRFHIVDPLFIKMEDVITSRVMKFLSPNSEV